MNSPDQIIVPFWGKDPETIKFDILWRLDQEHDIDGSYFDMVENPYHLIVEELVEKYSPQCENSPDPYSQQQKAILREQLARMWLFRAIVIEELAGYAGFTRVVPSIPTEEGNGNPIDVNEYEYLLFAEDGSYLFVGPHAFGDDGMGADAIYEYIEPQKNRSLVTHKKFDFGPEGLQFLSLPQENCPASTNQGVTSPILRLYWKKSLT